MTTVTPADFSEALRTAKPGDTIKLTGRFPATTISKKSELRFVSDGDAVFDSLNLTTCDDLDLNGIRISMPFIDGETNVNSCALRIYGCNRVAFANGSITGPVVPQEAVHAIDQTAPPGMANPGNNVRGLPTGTLLLADSSPDTIIEGTSLSCGWRGIAVNKGERIRVEGNDLHSLRTTPIAGYVISDAELLRNHSWNLTPWSFGGAGDHGDVIHLWTTRGQADHTRRVHIIEHLHEQRGANPSLGIYLDTNTNPMGFVGVDISSNVLINSNRQGMRLENCESCNVGGNILLPDDPPPSDSRDLPWITKYGRSSGDISRNRAFGFSLERETYFADVISQNDFSAPRPGDAAAAVAAWMQRHRPGVRA